MILELGQGCEGLLGLCSEASHCIIGLMDHKAVFGAALGGSGSATVVEPGEASAQQLLSWVYRSWIPFFNRHSDLWWRTVRSRVWGAGAGACRSCAKRCLNQVLYE